MNKGSPKTSDYDTKIISFAPMSVEEVNIFNKDQTIGYIEEKIKNHHWSEDKAQKLADESMQRLLPHGALTPGHTFLKAFNLEKEYVGNLWYLISEGDRGKEAFIYFIEVFPPYRGRGYANEIIKELEKTAKKENCKYLGLHVFGHNTTAQDVYYKAGFTLTSLNMVKAL